MKPEQLRALRDHNAELQEQVHELENQRDDLLVQVNGQEDLLRYAARLNDYLVKQRAQLRELLFRIGNQKVLKQEDQTDLLHLLSKSSPSNDPEEPNANPTRKATG